MMLGHLENSNGLILTGTGDGEMTTKLAVHVQWCCQTVFCKMVNV